MGSLVGTDDDSFFEDSIFSTVLISPFSMASKNLCCIFVNGIVLLSVLFTFSTSFASLMTIAAIFRTIISVFVRGAGG